MLKRRENFLREERERQGDRRRKKLTNKASEIKIHFSAMALRKAVQRAKAHLPKTPRRRNMVLNRIMKRKQTGDIGSPPAKKKLFDTPVKGNQIKDRVLVSNTCITSFSYIIKLEQSHYHILAKSG